MTRICIFLFTLLYVLIYSCAGIAGDIKAVGASASADYDYSQYNPKAELPADYKDYEEVYDYYNYNSIIDIFIKNKKTSQTQLFISLSDILNQHYHYYEYKNGNIYIIKRLGMNNYSLADNWTDELWKYNYKKQGDKIFSGRGLDFRVAPNEKYVMVKADSNDKFKIINLLDKQSHNIAISEILTPNEMKEYSYVNVTLVAWSNNSNICWAALTEGPDILMYIKIIPVSWNTTKYNLFGQIKFGGDESVFNPNNGRLVYSDKPFFYGADQAENFYKNKYQINLFLYDLNTQKNILINTSKAKKFNPKWVDDNTIEYDNPNGEGRVRYNISQ